MITPTKVVRWLWNYDFSGKAAVTYSVPSSVWAFDSKGNFVLLYKTYTKDAVIGLCSGRGVEMNDGYTYYLVTLKNQFKEYVFGYVSLKDFRFSSVKAKDEAKAKSEAQTLLNNLIVSDKNLAIKINTLNELYTRAEKKGIDVKQGRASLAKIAQVWKERQDSIKNNPAIQITKKISGIGCNQCRAQVGIVPLVVWAFGVGAATVIVGLTVYYFLKPEYNTSQLHSKYLSENEEKLRALLGPEEFTKLKKSVDSEIKENAQEAYSEGSSSGFMSLAKPLGLAAFSIWAFNKFSSSKKAA